MCEAVEKIVMEENALVEKNTREREIISAVKNASKSFNVSEEDAAEKLGYGVDAYETAKKHQNMTL